MIKKEFYKWVQYMLIELSWLLEILLISCCYLFSLCLWVGLGTKRIFLLTPRWVKTASPSTTIQAVSMQPRAAPWPLLAPIRQPLLGQKHLLTLCCNSDRRSSFGSVDMVLHGRFLHCRLIRRGGEWPWFCLLSQRTKLLHRLENHVPL